MYKTCVPSMIHSARPTVPQVEITILTWNLFCFLRFSKVGTDGWTDGQASRAKIMITTGRDCGSVFWINNKFSTLLLIPDYGWWCPSVRPRLNPKLNNGHFKFAGLFVLSFTHESWKIVILKSLNLRVINFLSQFVLGP